MLNNKFLFSSFISVIDTSALHIICFFIKIDKILEIIKILNDFYNVVRSKELGSDADFSSSFIRSKNLDSAVRSKELSSALSLIFSFIFSFIFFSATILVNFRDLFLNHLTR